MRVNGIIAEYNPFHNGHKYHLETAKKQTGADYTIIVMSGNFMQRGTPAVLNKHIRTEMALRNGADLVLEIPSFYAVGSAEFFASGAVSLLDKLGVVDTLCFGTEYGQKNILEQIADILLEEPDAYKTRLKIKLRQGGSFPNARAQALIEYCPALSNFMDLLNSPNNILGIEYIKALRRCGSAIQPSTTLRVGSDYHDKRLGDHQASALAIRHAIFSRQDLNHLKEQMPESAHALLLSHWQTWLPIHSNDFSLPLHYKLLNEEEERYDRYVDVSSDLSDRIYNNLYNYTNFRGFCNLLKSKELTYTRLSRCLMHILLDMKDETFASCQAIGLTPYAQVLGFRKDAAALLSAIKAHSSIPLVTKLADADKLLNEPALSMLKKDIAVSHIYNSVAGCKARQPMQNEYSTPLVIV